MDHYRAAKEGGFRYLSDENVTTFTSSKQIFANAPSGACHVIFTIRGATLSVRFSGGTASTTNGNDYPVGTYALTMALDDLKAIRVIESGGTCSGVFVTYFGRA